jgi:hypothetical protein
MIIKVILSLPMFLLKKKAGEYFPSLLLENIILLFNEYIFIFLLRSDLKKQILGLTNLNSI